MVAPPRKSTESDGHSMDGGTYGIVYANDLAREGWAAGSKFPVGSILVREKLSKPDDAVPQLVAVMVKRAPGFNTAGGDWEFLTVNGGLTKVTGRQRKGNCLDCHASQSDKDFVYPVGKGK
jgi:hypothetical protein